MATKDIETGEQHALFPELDTTKPDEKKLAKAAKRFHETETERAALLTTSKAERDEQMGEVRALMQKCNIDKFKIGKLIVTLVSGEPKVQVKVEKEKKKTDDDEAPAED